MVPEVSSPVGSKVMGNLERATTVLLLLLSLRRADWQIVADIPNDRST